MRQSEESKQRLTQQIQRLNIADKIKLALRGGSEERGVLIKDASREVVLAVLENPRITDFEVEAVARNRTSMEEALRAIAGKRDWTKNYSILIALVTNPKTPPGVGVRFVVSLKKRDLKLLEKNKNVPEAIRVAARKALRSRGYVS